MNKINTTLGQNLGWMTKQILEEKHKIKFKDFFSPSCDDYSEYENQEFEVIRELNDNERDPEVGRLYKIKFEDGTIIDAWADEVEA